MTFSKASKIKIAIGAAVVLVVGFFAFRGGSSGKPGGRAAPVIAVVKRQSLTQRVSITGQIQPKRRLDVRPPFTGYVAKLFGPVFSVVSGGIACIAGSSAIALGTPALFSFRRGDEQSPGGA